MRPSSSQTTARLQGAQSGLQQAIELAVMVADQPAFEQMTVAVNDHAEWQGTERISKTRHEDDSLIPSEKGRIFHADRSAVRGDHFRLVDSHANDLQVAQSVARLGVDQQRDVLATGLAPGRAKVQ